MFIYLWNVCVRVAVVVYSSVGQHMHKYKHYMYIYAWHIMLISMTLMQGHSGLGEENNIYAMAFKIAQDSRLMHDTIILLTLVSITLTLFLVGLVSCFFFSFVKCCVGFSVLAPCSM